jgi:hypothetical protein
MAEDDFTEDFEDDPIPEDFEEEPVSKPAPRKPIQPAQRSRLGQTSAPARQVVQAQAPASAPVQTQKVRFVPFELPARIGIFDNNTGKPLMEESPKDGDKLNAVIAKLDVIFGAVTELMNKITELEKDI